MKSFASIFLLTAALHVQGQSSGVFFNNRVVFGNERVNAPVYGVNPLDPFFRKSGSATTNGGSVDYTGHPLLAGTGFSASLWGAPVSQGFQAQAVVPQMQPLATIFFRTTQILPGYFQPAPIPVETPFATEANPFMLLQIRAWDNNGGTINSWASALADPTIALGSSDAFVLQSTFAPQVPRILVGLTSFNLTIVPEPTILALALPGLLAGMVYWRARRN